MWCLVQVLRSSFIYIFFHFPFHSFSFVFRSFRTFYFARWKILLSLTKESFNIIQFWNLSFILFFLKTIKTNKNKPKKNQKRIKNEPKNEKNEPKRKNGLKMNQIRKNERVNNRYFGSLLQSLLNECTKAF